MNRDRSHLSRYREMEERLWLPRNHDIDGFLCEYFHGNVFGNISYDLIFTFNTGSRDFALPVTPHVRVGPDLCETLSISIEREPRIISSNPNIHVSPIELETIMRMIRMNRVLLLDHWFGRHSTCGFIDMLRKID